MGKHGKSYNGRKEPERWNCRCTIMVENCRERAMYNGGKISG